MVLYTDGCDIETVLADSIFPSRNYPAERTAGTMAEKMPERERIQAALQATGSREEAAARLGMSRSTLWRKMKQYGFLGDTAEAVL